MSSSSFHFNDRTLSMDHQGSNLAGSDGILMTKYAGPKETILVTNGDEKVEIDLFIEEGEDSLSQSDDSSDDSIRSIIDLLDAIRNLPNLASLFFADHKKHFTTALYVLLFLGFLAYFICALVMDPTRAVPLISLTGTAAALVLYGAVKRRFGKKLLDCVQPVTKAVTLKWHIIKWIVGFVYIAGLITVIILIVWENPKNLISLAGLVTFGVFLFVFSTNPSKVNWRAVCGGLSLQFLFALMILKWDVGYKVFQFLGKQVQVFLSYTDHGASFVFGPNYADHLFAFKILPVVVFFSCTISTLYYLGAMQCVIGKIAWVMKVTLGTTAAESICAAGNIFIGQTEAPIMIRPFLDKMTKSELNAVMTGGFATMAGAVLAAYISFGVPAEHLLCASVMNAPCALAISKLFYPETEVSRIRNLKDMTQDEEKPKNILQAAATGASQSIKLVANIAANLIAFLAMLEFVNACLSWCGSMVDFPGLSFQWICSYAFMPVAYLMGVEWKDCGLVGELIGIKTFLNEFVAYKQLAEYMENRQLGTGISMSPRSEIISTYALCGFANLSSIGIQLGGLGSMAPNRKGDLAQVIIRSLIGGIIACLMTASIAGLLISEDTVMSATLNALSSNATVLNATAINATIVNATTYL